MQDNWYEATIDALSPESIISVVDWASDSSIPIRDVAPIPPTPSPEAATYNVFPWGVNDPTEGERSLEKENPDTLASPLGWHSLPAKNDPSYLAGSLREVKQSEIVNYTSTAGNNASLFQSISSSRHH